VTSLPFWWRAWRAVDKFCQAGFDGVFGWLRPRGQREPVNRYVCPHNDYLCDKYGCPDDPNWTGDR